MRKVLVTLLLLSLALTGCIVEPGGGYGGHGWGDRDHHESHEDQGQYSNRDR